MERATWSVIFFIICIFCIIMLYHTSADRGGGVDIEGHGEGYLVRNFFYYLYMLYHYVILYLYWQRGGGGYRGTWRGLPGQLSGSCQPLMGLGSIKILKHKLCSMEPLKWTHYMHASKWLIICMFVFFHLESYKIIQIWTIPWSFSIEWFFSTWQ